jgi:hypothetical protein
MEPQGKPVVPLQMPLGGEHPAPKDQCTHGTRAPLGAGMDFYKKALIICQGFFEFQMVEVAGVEPIYTKTGQSKKSNILKGLLSYLASGNTLLTGALVWLERMDGDLSSSIISFTALNIPSSSIPYFARRRDCGPCSTKRSGMPKRFT